MAFKKYIINSLKKSELFVKTGFSDDEVLSNLVRLRQMAYGRDAIVVQAKMQREIQNFKLS